jgi:hypothetical protein
VDAVDESSIERRVAIDDALPAGALRERAIPLCHGPLRPLILHARMGCVQPPAISSSLGLRNGLERSDTPLQNDLRHLYSSLSPLSGGSDREK